MRDCLARIYLTQRRRDAEFFGAGLRFITSTDDTDFFDMINMIVFWGQGSGFSLTEAQRTRRLLGGSALPGKLMH
jgi:hypothetical protein